MASKEDNGPYNIYAETEIVIEFYDVDPVAVVWHGNYVKYFETGRRTLLERIDYRYFDMQDSGYIFPIIDISIKYINSLRFMDRARIKTILMEYENRLKLKYEIRNAKTGLLTTKGITTQMAIDIKTGESCFVCPKGFTDKVEALLRK